MGLEQRPYVGTWALNRHKLVQHTPDALLFVNGDTSIPGCAKCNGRIDLQQFVTAISTDAGVEPSAASTQVSMSIPRHTSDTMMRDAEFLLRPGLEVHVYEKGYFPVEGMYGGLTTRIPTKFGKGKGKDKKVEQSTSFVEQFGIDRLTLEDIINYPYYHVFHGVVTQVDHAYSGGFWTGTLHCQGMLYFWTYQQISTNASVFGSRPANSKLKTSLVGHTFTKMSPYEIIYTLFHDVAGAAAGVGFALGSKSNTKGKSAPFKKNLFSLTLDYWKKRFSESPNKLRLFGVSGVLFSAAQAAFLGRLSTSQTSNVLRGRFPGKEKKSKNLPIVSLARALGFFSKRNRDALVWAQRTGARKKSDQDLNISQMQAFVSDISQFGQINLWESQYRSKMDMIQDVCNITGFEFYQDVDGDFVYKPPMYNLDTSSSRVYRIEDIDIISINFSEKEPNATFMTIKGSHFKNLRGMGLDNEWGTKGQYIDYRLVAQYGWREQTLEISYLTDPRAMFFAAVNRLDILNAPIKSASVTIPLRPEIRPGYPVYIPFLDCFYYLQALSHSFQFGSQCTTSLQLIAKRAKFFAPGDPNKSGLDAIDLKNTTLPPRPLLVAGNDGVPKMAGFPNVVMALDPDQINPLFFLVGADIDDIKNLKTLKNLITLASSDGYGMVVKEDDGTYTIPVGQSGKEYLQFRLGKKKLTAPTRQNARVIDIQGAAGVYSRLKTARAEKIRGINIRIAGQRRWINKLSAARQKLVRYRRSAKSVAHKDKQIDRAQAKINQYQQQIQGAQDAYKKELQKNEGVRVLVDLMKRVGDQYIQKNAAYRELNSTINLLDALSDKKASFTTGNLPGSYVYYSASHPDPKFQGVTADFDKDTPGNLKKGKGKLTKLVKTKGFLKTVKTKYADGTKAEAEIGEITPTHGLRILLNNSTKEEPVSTSEIKTISFVGHKILTRSRYSIWKPGSEFKGLDPAIKDAVKRIFTAVAKGKIVFATPVSNVFFSTWTNISTWTKLGISGPVFGSPITVPAKASGGAGSILPAKDTFGAAKSRTGQTGALSNFVKFVASALADSWYRQANRFLLASYSPTNTAFKKVQKDPKATNADRERAQKLAKNFSKIVQGVVSMVRRKDTKKARIRQKGGFIRQIRARILTKTVESPVFPISDENGYQVIGSYRYGRGVTIEPNGVFDQLLKQDPTNLLTPQQIKDYSDAILGRRNPPASVSIKLYGKTVTKQIRATGASVTTEKDRIKAANKERSLRMMEALAAKVPKGDLLRYGLATVNKDNPTQLDFQLANFPGNSRDGIAKLPVNNAAFSLADLQRHVRKNICECKTAEADLLIEAFGKDKFIPVAPTGGVADNPQNADKMTKWLSNQTVLQEPAWKANQQALRGEILDRRGPGLIKTFKDEISRFASSTSTVESGFRAVGRDFNSEVQNFQADTGTTPDAPDDLTSVADVVTDDEGNPNV